MDTAFKVTASFFLILIVDIMPRSRVISIDLGIESFLPLKSKKLVRNWIHVPHFDNTFKSQF